MYLLEMVIFHSYVQLPEGITIQQMDLTNAQMEFDRWKLGLTWLNNKTALIIDSGALNSCDFFVPLHMGSCGHLIMGSLHLTFRTKTFKFKSLKQQ
jgi:hypothetical protein